jgi:hypothetical protein
VTASLCVCWPNTKAIATGGAEAAVLDAFKDE